MARPPFNTHTHCLRLCLRLSPGSLWLSLIDMDRLHVLKGRSSPSSVNCFLLSEGLWISPRLPDPHRKTRTHKQKTTETPNKPTCKRRGRSTERATHPPTHTHTHTHTPAHTHTHRSRLTRTVWPSAPSAVRPAASPLRPEVPPKQHVQISGVQKTMQYASAQISTRKQVCFAVSCWPPLTYRQIARSDLLQ